MASLSILRESGAAIVAANPIFPLNAINVHGGAEIRFEVFEEDAGELKSIVGKRQCFCFYIDESSGMFWAQLQSLEPCLSSHVALALLQDKVALQGVLVVIEEGKMRQ